MKLRQDLHHITQWIEPGSRVLDLGCGDGSLLHYLQTKYRVTGYGLEIDPNNIEKCIQLGVNVIQTNLDAGLSQYFEDNSFDYVIMTQTLQAVHFPTRLLNDMLSVGREGIITLPNIGYWHARLQLMFRGRLPITEILPNQWHNTPNIRLCTLSDFEETCKENNIKICQRIAENFSHNSNHFMAHLWPNLFAETALYLVRKEMK